jgi:hypothetical protein
MSSSTSPTSNSSWTSSPDHGNCFHSASRDRQRSVACARANGSLGGRHAATTDLSRVPIGSLDALGRMRLVPLADRRRIQASHQAAVTPISRTHDASMGCGDLRRHRCLVSAPAPLGRRLRPASGGRGGGASPSEPSRRSRPSPSSASWSSRPPCSGHRCFQASSTISGRLSRIADWSRSAYPWKVQTRRNDALIAADPDVVLGLCSQTADSLAISRSIETLSFERDTRPPGPLVLTRECIGTSESESYWRPLPLLLGIASGAQAARPDLRTVDGRRGGNSRRRGSRGRRGHRRCRVLRR